MVELVSRVRDTSRGLVLAGLVCLSSAAWGQISLVNVTGCGPGAFPATVCTVPSSSSGNLIVVGFQGKAADTVTSISDNAGNTYVRAGSGPASDSLSIADIWYAANSAAGATAITINISPSGNTGAATIWQFSGVAPSSPLDQTSVLNSQAATTTPSGASVTIGTVPEAIVSLAAVQNTITGISSGNSFTNDEILNGNGFAHLLAPSSGTYAAQWNQNSAGTFASNTASFKAASGGSGSGAGPCDLNQDGVVNSTDVTLAVNMAIGTQTCTANLEGADTCTVITVQRVVNASEGQTCITYNTHAATLSWTASTSSNVSYYNIYRGSASGGPYNKIGSTTPNSGATSYKDTSVSGGQTYYYVATTVDTSGNESGQSNQAAATIPTP